MLIGGRGEAGALPPGGASAVRVSYQPVRTATKLGRWSLVKLLQRLLKVDAALWSVFSLALLIAPAWVLEGLLDQPPLSQYAWMRTIGVMGLVLAMLMVLVGQKIEDLWWWSWSFAILAVGTATVFALTALLGVPSGAAAWPWWALAAVSAAVGAGLLVGMSQAGEEKPFA